MKKILILCTLVLSISPVYAHQGIIGETLNAIMYICFGNEPSRHHRREGAVVINNTTAPTRPKVKHKQSATSVVTPTTSTPNEPGHWEQHTSPLGYTTKVWIPDPPANVQPAFTNVSEFAIRK